jgi:hypothetical protein
MKFVMVFAEWDLCCVGDGVERMKIAMVFRVMGFVVSVRRRGEDEICNGLWGMGFVVRVRRCGEKGNFNGL